MQIEHAPHKSVRCQVIKLADKISNPRSLLASPPANWNTERKRQYFEWAREVVNALTRPILVGRRSLTRRMRNSNDDEEKAESRKQ